METIRNIIEFATANWMTVVGALTVILTGIIAIAELIPGEQPEKTLKKIVGWLEKVSRK